MSILNKLVDLDLNPKWDNVLSGKVVIKNDNLIVLLNFDDASGTFDGFSVVNSDDVGSCYEWDEEDIKDLETDNSEFQIKGIQGLDFSSFQKLCKSLGSELVAIYDSEEDEGDEESYFVGRIKSIDENAIVLRTVDPDGNWSEEEEFDLDEIRYLGFKTKYEYDILNLLN